MENQYFDDTLTIIVSREEIETQDIEPALSFLHRFIESPQIARSYMEKINIAFDGYNQTKIELFEMQEVRNYIYKLAINFHFGFIFCQSIILASNALCFAFCHLISLKKLEQKSIQHGWVICF